MALATFPDGSLPEPIEVARIASNMFAAGQETTVQLMGIALQRIAEDQDLQDLLRARPRSFQSSSRKRSASKRPSRDRSDSPKSPPASADSTSPPAPSSCCCTAAGPRSPALRQSGRVRRRTCERQAAPRLRPRHPHLPGRSARSRRSGLLDPALPRTHRAHMDRRRAPRPEGRPRMGPDPKLQVPRPQPPLPRVHAERGA